MFIFTVGKFRRIRRVGYPVARCAVVRASGWRRNQACQNNLDWKPGRGDRERSAKRCLVAGAESRRPCRNAITEVCRRIASIMGNGNHRRSAGRDLAPDQRRFCSHRKERGVEIRSKRSAESSTLFGGVLGPRLTMAIKAQATRISTRRVVPESRRSFEEPRHRRVATRL